MVDKEINPENAAGFKRVSVTDSRVTVCIDSAKRRIHEEIKSAHELAGNTESDALENRKVSSAHCGGLLANTQSRLSESSGLLRIDQGPRRTRINQPPIRFWLTFQ